MFDQVHRHFSIFSRSCSLLGEQFSLDVEGIAEAPVYSVKVELVLAVYVSSGDILVCGHHGSRAGLTMSVTSLKHPTCTF